MDRTFRLNYVTLFTIHIVSEGHYVPLVFCFFFNIFNANGKRALLLIVKQCSDIDFQFQPEVIVADNEICNHVAVTAVWPCFKIIGGRLQVGQSWYRKILQLVLSMEYKNSRSGDTILTMMIGFQAKFYVQ